MPRSSTRLSVIFLTVFIAGRFRPDHPGAALLGRAVRRIGVRLWRADRRVFPLAVRGDGRLVGGLSDRVGRRPVLLASIAIAAVGYLLFGLASGYAWLIAARAIAGFAGGNISVAQAYIADV